MRAWVLVSLMVAVGCAPQQQAPEDGGSAGGAGTGGGGDTGGGGGTGGGGAAGSCVMDADCAALAAAAMPAGCASATCESALCVLRTRDDDGDGESANACTASVTVVTGPDCDDRPGAGAGVNSQAPERCDTVGVDDDCDGAIDEGCACANPGVDLPCCSGRGLQTCEAIDGGTALGMCSALVTPERCNGIDDDCDALVDDSPDLTTDGGPSALDGGFVFPDGGCKVGEGACQRFGTGLCLGGAAGCDAVPGAPAVETCNAIDDDCDGVVDPPDASLCTISGQSCDAGRCACPGTQSVCGNGCANVGESCAVGMGGCVGQGTFICDGGAVQCTAMLPTPTTEVCDGRDNDCDGQVDEGTRVTCYADPDDDNVRSNSTSSQQCFDTARAMFGYCPVGFTATTIGTDCAPTDSTRWRSVTVRPDADGDGRCTSSSSNACVGSSLPAGTRESSSCTSTTDCNDANASVWQTFTVRTDADGDAHCVGAPFSGCGGSGPPSGTRLSGSCASPDDCNEGFPQIWRTDTLSKDFDGDGWCDGAGVATCYGATLPSGYRLTTTCQGQDCNDSNFNARATCYITRGYTTVIPSKSCGIGPPPCEVQNHTIGNDCPQGFVKVNYRTETNAGTICNYLGPTQSQACCGSVTFGSVFCHVVADCQAI